MNVLSIDEELGTCAGRERRASVVGAGRPLLQNPFTNLGPGQKVREVLDAAPEAPGKR
jgi:hypothetical protein